MMLMRGLSFYFMSSFCTLLPEVILTHTFMTWDTTVNNNNAQQLCDMEINRIFVYFVSLWMWCGIQHF